MDKYEVYIIKYSEEPKGYYVTRGTKHYRYGNGDLILFDNSDEAVKWIRVQKYFMPITIIVEHPGLKC